MSILVARTIANHLPTSKEFSPLHLRAHVAHLLLTSDAASLPTSWSPTFRPVEIVKSNFERASLFRALKGKPFLLNNNSTAEAEHREKVASSRELLHFTMETLHERHFASLRRAIDLAKAIKDRNGRPSLEDMYLLREFCGRRDGREHDLTDEAERALSQLEKTIRDSLVQIDGKKKAEDKRRREVMSQEYRACAALIVIMRKAKGAFEML